MLKTIGSEDDFRAQYPSGDVGFNLNIGRYFGILKNRFFQFLLPLGIISIVGLVFTSLQKPSYLSEGKILVESQSIAADLVKPLTSDSVSERVHLVQQRVVTRDNLRLIARKLGLFPQLSDAELLDAMREGLTLKLVDDATRQQWGQGPRAVVLLVGFEYPDPSVARRVASEFVELIVSEDERSRTSRSTEMVKLLANETQDIQAKLESVQTKMSEIARLPRDTLPEISEQQKTQIAQLSTLKAELVQKSASYSDAHPVIIALKKRITEMEKAISQPFPKPTRSTSEDSETLKQQREGLEKQLASANDKLAGARLSEKLDQEQQSERMQVVEPPTLPQKPLKSNRLKMVGISFAAAAILGLAVSFGTEFLSGAIRDRQQLASVVADHFIVCIPYIPSSADIRRSRMRLLAAIASIAVLLVVWLALAAAILLNEPIGLPLFEKMGIDLHLLGR